MPNLILIAVFPELRLYGFRPAYHLFAELLTILEKDGALGLGVPNRILIVVFPELRLYGFRPGNRPFPELLRILEEDGAPGLGGATMQKRKPIVIASGSAVEIEIGSVFDRYQGAGQVTVGLSFWVAGPRIVPTVASELRRRCEIRSRA